MSFPSGLIKQGQPLPQGTGGPCLGDLLLQSQSRAVMGPFHSALVHQVFKNKTQPVVVAHICDPSGSGG